MEAASGIEFQSLPDGSVLIRFQNNDLATINEQVVTQEVLEALPILVRLLRANYTIKEENMSTNDTETREALLNLICERFNDDVAEVASDAMLDILQDAPEQAMKLLAPIVVVSDYWAEQLARAAFDLPNDHIDDLEFVLQECMARCSGEDTATKETTHGN